MRFEKTVIGIAENYNVIGAYFCEGTLFIPMHNDLCNVEAFRQDVEDAFPETRLILGRVGGEVAVDFVSKSEFGPYATHNS